MIAKLSHFHGPEQSKILPMPAEEFDEGVKIQGLRRPIGAEVLKRVPAL
jgi:hypothetical protein